VGNKVTYLKRVSIGGLSLDEKLAIGECREILHNEIEKIYAKK
jgi:16S rRNA pseudouridine516 synthase